MSKTVLTRVHLDNWYGFIDVIIPIAEDLTLISGENECGKSTILDAIKYAFTGDTQFNKASTGGATGIGKRNLYSYTRCLIDASAGRYAREPEQIPMVYSHIAMEYKEGISGRMFVLGVVIETGSAEVRDRRWYVADGKKLEDISPIYEEEGAKRPYDGVKFLKKYQLEGFATQEGIARFMQMVGLKIPFKEVKNYQRKLRNIMTYNPGAKIQEFIKESVLEEHNVKFENLKEAKRNIDRLNRSFDQINKEVNDLQEILAEFDKMDKADRRLKVNHAKTLYKNVCECRIKKEELEEQIREASTTIRLMAEELKKLENREWDLDTRLTEARRELQESDAAKAILSVEQAIGEYERKLAVLRDEIQQIREFEETIRNLRPLLKENHIEIPQPDLSERLSAIGASPTEKIGFAERFKAGIEAARDDKVGEERVINDRIYGVEEEIRLKRQIVEACEKNKADYSFASEEMALVAEINREFEKEGIDGVAKPACDYVVGLKDESWRDAIEAFLGGHRYAIIVSPEHFDIANRVMDRSKHRYVELVNTKRLMRKEMKPNEGSVFEKLDIRNEVAAAYFCFWLGRIHAASKETVADYGSAMSKEGKLSRNMAVTYINFRRLKSYALGGEAIELNRKNALKRIEELKQDKENLDDKLKDIRFVIGQLKQILSAFREFEWGAPDEEKMLSMTLAEEKKRYDELVEAQKNNAEFIALSQQVAKLEEDYTRAKTERRETERERDKKGLTLEHNEKELEVIDAKLTRAEETWDEEKDLYPQAVKQAVEEYDGFLAGDKSGSDVMKDETRMRTERLYRQETEMILQKQAEYNARKAYEEQLPTGISQEAVYQKRKDKIWVDDLQGIKQKLKEQTHTYERVFKNEFVLMIYETARDAIHDIREINKELRKLQFSTQYQFDVKMLRDSSEYAKILEFAEYLNETNNIADGQRTIVEVAGYDPKEASRREEEIHDIINRLVENDDSREIEKYADYRNYMSYEITINNDEVKDGKLSKQVGYNSGAGTQIPYTLILSAALSMLYNIRTGATRLIFIDEPFEKMSDHNIRLMLSFFKAQDFQVIFCAPPNKLESIGSECGVVIPVLKISNENMQIGQVRFGESN